MKSNRLVIYLISGVLTLAGMGAIKLFGYTLNKVIVCLLKV